MHHISKNLLEYHHLFKHKKSSIRLYFESNIRILSLFSKSSGYFDDYVKIDHNKPQKDRIIKTSYNHFLISLMCVRLTDISHNQANKMPLWTLGRLYQRDYYSLHPCNICIYNDILYKQPGIATRRHSFIISNKPELSTLFK